jgi:hypothetical protein
VLQSKKTSDSLRLSCLEMLTVMAKGMRGQPTLSFVATCVRQIGRKKNTQKSQIDSVSLNNDSDDLSGSTSLDEGRRKDREGKTNRMDYGHSLAIQSYYVHNV